MTTMVYERQNLATRNQEFSQFGAQFVHKFRNRFNILHAPALSVFQKVITAAAATSIAPRNSFIAEARRMPTPPPYRVETLTTAEISQAQYSPSESLSSSKTDLSSAVTPQ